MSLRTPLSRVTGLGSAKSGTTHFLRQRLTAVANVPLTLFFVWLMVSLIGSDRAEIMAMFSNPLISTLAILTIVSVTWHMRLGAQMVIEDYITSEGLKLFLVIANIFFSTLIGALAIIAVLQLGFGG